MENKKINLCQPQELGMSCFGCCGHSYRSNEEVKQSILRNTHEYLSLDKDPEAFNSRCRQDQLCASGVCRNVIFITKDFIGCPLHPLQHDGIEYRDQHCDIKFECATKRQFDLFAEKDQEDFIRFLKKEIKQNNLDSIAFSIMMDKGDFLKKYMEG